MSIFRNDLGAAVEQIARLEEENRALRAELARLDQPGAAPAHSRKPPRTLPWDAGFLGLVLVAGVVGVLANLHLSKMPLVMEGSGTTSLASTTGTSTELDVALGCTTPFVYEVQGEVRRACLSMPP